jgi:hypothetical protein
MYKIEHTACYSRFFVVFHFSFFISQFSFYQRGSV